MAHLAKVFTNGRSQAIRLPAEYRFKSKEVYIRRNEDTGEVLLSEKPDSWSSFLDMLEGLDVPEDFLRGGGQAMDWRSAPNRASWLSSSQNF